MSKKISELEESTNIYEGCCLPIVTMGETKKVTYKMLRDKLNEDTKESDPTVPSHVKNITEADVYRWNNNSGGGTITFNETLVTDGYVLANKIMTKDSLGNVFISGECHIATGNFPGGYVHIFTLGPDVRPKSSMITTCVVASGGVVLFRIDTDGAVSCNVLGVPTNVIYFSHSYNIN